MRHIVLRLRGLLIDEEAATATEYAVMLGLVIVVALAAIAGLGGNTSAVFGDVGTSITGDGGGGGNGGFFSDARKYLAPWRWG